MRTLLFTFSALSIVSGSLSSSIPDLSTRHAPRYNAQAVCQQIVSAVSNASQVFFPPSNGYTSDNEHSFVSNSELSACSVEPGSTKDLGLILHVLRTTSTQFGVKSGGHATNRGFSSTRGVQISLARFNTFNVNTEAHTVELGPGLTWDDVYERLDPYGVNVIGGRISGVGVGGLTLGGGYSFLSNQYGLAIDNVIAFELVLPNGTVTTATEANHHDLWFALRGGGNNFGIVTKLTVKSYPQGQVWGGAIVYGPDQLDAVKNAVAEFTSKVTDTKASLNTAFAYTSGGIVSTTLIFYDGPSRPSGIFDNFLSIPNQQTNVDTRSFTEFVKAASSATPPGNRGSYCGFPTTKYSPNFLDAITDQVTFWGKELTALESDAFVVAIMEPFDSTLFSHGAPSAYPPDRSLTYFPSFLTFTWSNATLDQTMLHAQRQNANTLRAAALKDGQDVKRAAVYPNYALFDTPLEDMYGQNLPRLRKLKRAIDPKNVMGLTGGFKF
ncbi:FAD-binding domain-containing protein [Lactarius indigo]|nr:FAD-binding domain-containing protein [Lactarius indigo]